VPNGENDMPLKEPPFGTEPEFPFAATQDGETAVLLLPTAHVEEA
jgi:hypothetical protein